MGTIIDTALRATLVTVISIVYGQAAIGVIGFESGQFFRYSFAYMVAASILWVGLLVVAGAYSYVVALFRQANTQ